ncbi:bifunctional DNA-formamidopyrimidine glycosylase/DNA-(apurinic or apyrimidinic site) lyase [Patescibacteria group bacterium]|nr:bifunctional DNA-formamidopyrimidine glycosylase/DNA-(apurinic or apyrimidinic site) lyase [Patescibacteria group bacterium]
MPELPEVETIKLQLNSVLHGLIIKDVRILKPKSFIGSKEDITGEKIIGLRRFAKILVLDFKNGLSLAIHLKMSGQLVYRGKKQPKNLHIADPLLLSLPNKHTRVIVDFSNGDMLFFNDLRIFGWMRIVKSQTSNLKPQNLEGKYIYLDNLVKNLGPEPFKDLTLNVFRKILKLSNKPVKAVLMDQERISGVGNIYANDSLFLSGIHPKRKATELSVYEINKLYVNLLKVLRDGLKWGGASENNFRDAFGEMGKVQEHFYVYGRDKEKCIRCGETIRKIKLGGRGTFFCPVCQP